jgi:hypothetical protein
MKALFIVKLQGINEFLAERLDNLLRDFYFSWLLHWQGGCAGVLPTSANYFDFGVENIMRIAE